VVNVRFLTFFHLAIALSQ